MELPFYFSLTDFQNNFKLDFVQLSESEQSISLFDYLESLREKYSNALTHFNNAISDLQYLKMKMFQKQQEKLNNYFTANSETTIVNISEQIQQFNDTYKFPLDLLGGNAPQLEKFIGESISEMQKIIGLIRFEVANIPKTLQPDDSTTEPYKEKEIGSNIPYKLALLDEMGVIQNLNMKFTNKTDIYKILQFLTGGNIDNVKNYCNSIYGNYSGTNQITEKHRDKAKEFYYK